MIYLEMFWPFLKILSVFQWGLLEFQGLRTTGSLLYDFDIFTKGLKPNNFKLEPIYKW